MNPSTSRLSRIDVDPIEAGSELVSPTSFGTDASRAFLPATTIPNGVIDEALLAGILDEACFLTGATGAAIALRVQGEIICCATAGPDSPNLGTRLVSGQGLSGSCIQTGQLQQTSDTETDPRVDRETCRLLGVRSIVVLPLTESGELLGIFELLSSQPKAFGHRHLSQLQVLAKRIVESRLSQRNSDPTSSPKTTIPDTMSAETLAREIFMASQQEDTVTPRRKPWSVIQILAVIAVALLLGWMVGRAGWKMAVDRAESQLSSPSQETPPATQTPEQTPIPSEPAMPAPATPEAKSAADNESQTLPVASHDSETIRVPLPHKLSSNTGYVLQRVQPEYPEEAKQQHIQGQVVMTVVVGTNGLVRDLVVTSGDLQLVNAAANAVRQWRFKPQRLKGRPIEFETQITVNFALS